MPHEIFRHVDFPFVDGQFPRNLGAVVQRTVLNGQEPAREVVHAGDNSWLIGDGVNDPNVPGAVVVTGIVHVVEADPSLAELATLPIGHIAERTDRGRPWSINLHEWAGD